jgi:hypothetical protein
LSRVFSNLLISLSASVGSNPTLSASLGRRTRIRSMVVRIGYSATTSRESRQARKGAAAAAMSGAGIPAGADHLQTDEG